MTNQQTVDFDGPIGPSMSEFSSEYMTYVESHLDEDLTHVPDRILALLRSMQSLTQGFVVDQLEHSLQTATRAERGGADLDMIVASLCHDIGKTISNANHPAIAAEMIRPWVSPEAYWVVKVHQDFQGLHYYARMGLDPMMRLKHEGHPAYDAGRQVRRRVGPDGVRSRLRHAAARALRADGARGVRPPAAPWRQLTAGQDSLPGLYVPLSRHRQTSAPHGSRKAA